MADISLLQFARSLGSKTVSGIAQKVGFKWPPPPTISVRDLVLNFLPTIVFESVNEPWSNWAGNQAFTPYRHCHPQRLQHLITIIQEAEGVGKRARAVGSSWSFSDVAMTGDYLVETNQMNNVLTRVLSSALNATAAGRQLVHVEAGIKVKDLCDYLDKHGVALTTMGGSDGQSLAGILSTVPVLPTAWLTACRIRWLVSGRPGGGRELGDSTDWKIGQPGQD